MNRTYHGVTAAIVVIGASSLGSTQEAAPPQKKDESLGKLVRVAESFSLSVAGKDLKLKPAPVLRWGNPTRATPDGATFVWTLDDRPLAMGCVWYFRGVRFAFHSLAQEPIQATRGDRVIWKCDKPGIILERFADSPVPAETVATRAKQLRDLARRFKCRLAGRADEDLRLLPQPVYVWDRKGDKLTNLALFAFAQGTDPEVILLLETIDTAKGQEWRYALTRRTSLPLEADLQGRNVWSVKHSSGTRREPWYHSGLPDRD